MLRFLTITFLLISVFCLGQWCVDQGYTVKKAWAWTQAQLNSNPDTSRWLNYVGLGQMSSMMKRPNPARAPRTIPGSSQSKNFKPAPAVATPAPVTPAPPVSHLDEEGLSPTDREALIGLLK